MGKADIEEEILHRCLGQRENKHFVPGAAVRDKQPAVENTADNPGENACKSKTVTGKQDLLERVSRSNAEQVVSNFNSGECAAPEERAEHGTENQKQGIHGVSPFMPIYFHAYL